MNQLHEDQKQLEGLLNAAQVGVVQSSADGVILRANKTFCEMLGYDMSEIVGSPHSDFVHPDFRVPPENFDRLVHGGIGGYDRRKKYVCKDGSALWSVVSVSLQQGLAGGSPYTVSVIRDITVQKHAEDELQAELIDNARLHEISARLISSNNPDHLFEELVVAAVDITRADRGTLQLFDDETRTLRLLASHGLNKEMIDNFQAVSAKSQTSCSEAMLSGERVVVSNYETDKPFAGTQTARAHIEAGVSAAQSTPLRSRSGHLVGMISTHWNAPHEPEERQLRLVDILARQAADLIERMRTEELTRFQAGLLDAVEQAVIATDARGVVTYCNRFAEELYGWRREEITGLSILEVTPAPEMERRASEIMRRLSSGESWSGEFLVRRRDGSEFWASVTDSPVFDDRGTLAGVIGISADISEKKKAEIVLRESERRQAFLLNVSDAIRVQEDEATIGNIVSQLLAEHMGLDRVYLARFQTDEERIWVGPEYKRADLMPITGYHHLSDFPETARNIQTETLVFDDVAHDPHLSKKDKKAFAAIGLSAFISAPIRKDGTHVLWALTAATSEPKAWTPNEVALMEEVAERAWGAVERARAEAALRQINETLEQRVMERTVNLESLTERLRLLANELTETEQRERRRLAEIIHDHLQQLLVAARMQVNIMRPSGNRESGELAASLLDQAIEQARTLTAQLRPPALYESGFISALKWLAGLMDEMHGLNVQLDLDTDAEPDVDQGAVLLFQSVRELLLNVAKYAGVTEARVAMRKTRDDTTIISVEDAGKGFDVTSLEDSAPQSGGFGLFSVRERMRAMGGECEILSAPGAGTKALLHIPIDRTFEGAAARESPVADETGAALGPGFKQEHPDGLIRVVIADDHSIVRQGVAGIVESAHDMILVLEVADGRAAQEAAVQLRPHVVVMDVNMPGMSGLQATRAIRETAPDVGVIGLSIHSDDAIRHAMMEAGAKAYHSKDGPAEELINSIRIVAGRAVAHAEG